jgi:septum formation protein
MRKIESPPVILGSASPRRKELLESIGWAVVVHPVEVDETPAAGEGPREYVLRMAREKSRVVLSELAIGEGIAITADTTVALEGEIYGKPRNSSEAADMLQRLQGRAHEVWTGVCVARGNRQWCEAAMTRVWFDRMSRDEIAEYVSSGEPMDKAGAYGIQGRAAQYVQRIEGDYTNVVGLPLATVRALVNRALQG